MPIRPTAAALRYSSRGKVPASSHAVACGAISLSTKRRTLARKASCSALKYSGRGGRSNMAGATARLRGVCRTSCLDNPYRRAFVESAHAGSSLFRSGGNRPHQVTPMQTDASNATTPDAAPLAPAGSTWAALRDAIRGTGADYTKIPLRRAVFLLAVPMVLELVLESTFAVVDVFFVAQLGSSAVATVGLTESFLFLLYSIAIGLTMGVTAIIARRIGEQKQEEAAITAVQAIFVAVLLSVPFAVVGTVWAQDLLRLMGADAWTLEHGYRYMQWMLGGNAVIMLLFVIDAICRGAVDAAVAMRVLWVANALNSSLDPILIFGLGPIPAMGVEGAAIATNIGRGAGVLMQLWILFRGGKHIRVLRSQLVLRG